MNRNELKTLIVGPIATVPTPFDEDFHVDLGRMAEMTRWWVESGLVKGRAVIKVAAAMGEGPQLSDQEWPPLLRTVVQAAGDKATIVCGLHYKETLRAIDDAKRASDLGAVALQVSPPCLNAPTQDDIVRHYGDMSDAIDIGIMAYVVNGMPGGSIYPDTFRRMAGFERLVSIKWTPPPGVEYEEISDLVDVVNIIDNTKDPVRNHRMGGRGYINWTAEVHPPHDLKLWDLLESRRYDEAQALWDSVHAPLLKMMNKTSERSGGQARLKKGMMKVMGRPMGDSRPPSLPLLDEELDELRELLAGFGWPVPEKAEAAGVTA